MENKPRLIDADKLIQEHGCDVTNWDEPYAVSIRSIECAPTVDAMEVVHGRWIRNAWSDYSCSACNCQLIGHGAFGWNYCPNCGARMNLEEK